MGMANPTVRREVIDLPTDPSAFRRGRHFRGRALRRDELTPAVVATCIKEGRCTTAPDPGRYCLEADHNGERWRVVVERNGCGDWELVTGYSLDG